MKTLVLESTSPFQGLPELVAYDEGLFAREGVEVKWVDRDEAGVKATESLVPSPKGVNPFGSHGNLLEQGKADMYNACEWGNYCRVQDTAVGSRQVGRRGIVTYAAIVVPPHSPVYTAQQLADWLGGMQYVDMLPLKFNGKSLGVWAVCVGAEGRDDIVIRRPAASEAAPVSRFTD